MTVDTSYQPGVVQVRQNGSLCVVSGTTISVESGGILRVESGGVVNLAAGSALNLPVAVMSTTSGAIPTSGITTIGTTVQSAYTLAAPPTAGAVVIICDTVHGATTVNQTVTSAVGVFCAGSTATKTIATFTSNIQSIMLVAPTTLNWAVASNNGVVAWT